VWSTNVVRFQPAVVATATCKSLKAREEMVVIRIFASWNQLDGWLRQVEGLRRVA
jgi:hypothetical protein